MMKECIILAGGLGTRLRDTVPDLPKCMAPVAGRPFLYYVINYFRSQGINDFIFSLGYKHEVIEAYLKESFSTLDYKTVIEDEPLGTGGAIRLALKAATAEQVVVANGDTLYRARLDGLWALAESNELLAVLGLKPMKHFDRYGVVDIAGEIVTGFREKQFYSEGLINAGLYIINRQAFLDLELPEKFSFETAFLEPQAGTGKLGAVVHDGYFIDIGIPEDFRRASAELALPPLDLSRIDKSWTLFLDRDGVINVDHPGSYIFVPEEFEFLPGAPELFKKLTEKFQFIIVATNQRGVGRKLMTVQDLDVINSRMQEQIAAVGGEIRKVYAATALNDNDWFRKPNPGMAVQAKKDFPEIDLSKSIMIGNNITDMEFGKNAGMYTIFVTTTSPEVTLPHPEIDLIFPTLNDFAKAL